MRPSSPRRPGTVRGLYPVALILLLVRGLPGATYYVATTGDDSNPGTSNAPFLTIQQGVNVARSGDFVLVADGNYGPDGNYTCGTECSQTGFAAPVTISNSGTRFAPITIAAQHKWGAKLDCQLPFGYAGDGTDGIEACDAYFSFTGTASYVTISGFDITRAYWVGAMVNDGNSHISFVGNHFHHIGNRIYTVPPGTSSLGIVGVYSGNAATYIAWDQNQFDHIGRLPHSGALVDDDYTHDHGLYINNGPYTVTNNVFFGQGAGWDIQTAKGVHDLAVTNNTFVGGYNPLEDGCLMLWGRNTNVAIENNIFYNCPNYPIADDATTQTNSIVDHNIVFGSPFGLIASYRGTLAQTNNLMNANPLFVNPAANDYHLQAGSPAIASGAPALVFVDFDGGLRPRGRPIDIGAFQHPGHTTTASSSFPGVQ